MDRRMILTPFQKTILFELQQIGINPNRPHLIAYYNKCQTEHKGSECLSCHMEELRFIKDNQHTLSCLGS